MVAVDAGILTFALILLLLLLSYSRYSRRVQEAYAMLYAGEYVQAAEGLRKLSGPVAWLLRLFHPGAIDGDIAVAYLLAGDMETGADWTARALRRARRPLARICAHNAAARLCARLGRIPEMMEHLRAVRPALRRASLGALFRQSASAASCCVDAGCLDYAIEILREARQTDDDWGSPQLRLAAFLTLECLGRHEAVLSHGRGSLALRATPPAGAAGVHPGDAGKTVLARQLARVGECELRVTVLRAAANAGRWDLFESYVSWLDSLKPPSLTVARLRLGLLGTWHAHQGDAASARRCVAELRELPASRPRLRTFGAAVRVGAASILQDLGDHPAALELLREVEASPLYPLLESERDARMAVSLEAMGQQEEADERRRQSAARAPLARWNHTEPPVPLPQRLEESLHVVIEGLAIGDDRGPCDPLSKPPLARVTASASVWAWALAVFAVVPVLGAGPGVGLVTLGAYLLFRRPALPHDRRAGVAGLVLGLLSMGFAGLYVGHWVGLWKPTGSYQTDMEDQTEPTEAYEADAGFADEEGAEDRLAPEEYEGASADGSGPRVSITWPVGILYFVVLILSIMFHELGHALSAYWAGDPTARDRGRLSLNPIRHLSLFGSFIVPLVLILLPGDAFIGWAKPVPVMPGRIRRPRLGRLGVSLAGVSANVILALLAANVLAALLIVLGLVWPGFVLVRAVIPFTLPLLVGLPHETVWAYVIEGVKATVFVNVFLAWFNLLPVPPLDGYGAIRSLLPAGLGGWLDRRAGFGTVLLLGLIALNLLTYVLVPAIVAALVLLQLGIRIAGW